MDLSSVRVVEFQSVELQQSRRGKLNWKQKESKCKKATTVSNGKKIFVIWQKYSRRVEKL